MKKNDIILLLSVIIYSWMFYNQSAGLNFLIFNVAVLIGLPLKNSSVLKDKFWLSAATGTFLTAVAVMYYGSPLAVIANVISLSLLSALSVSRKSSVFLALFYSFISYVSAFAFMIVDLLARMENRSKEKISKHNIKALMWVLIIFIVILFFVLYQKSNPLFRNLTEQINFDFISFRWLSFTLLGFVLLYGFYYHRNVPDIYNKEINSPDNLDEEKINSREIKFFGKIINVHSENRAGVMLFFLLNILLLIVNALDTVYLWAGSGGLPEGMTYSDSVHQGTGTLILSIIIAIIIILYIFRGHQNFFKENKLLIVLVLIWIIQNALMTVSTAYRNLLYVEEYSLTYKRIGVWFYLLLALIGLIITYIKIWKKKNNWYLFRKNGWAFYVVLVAASLLNWPMIVTKHNMSHSRELDKQYLLSLSYANLAELTKIEPPADEIVIPARYVANDYYKSNFWDRTFTKSRKYDVARYDKNFTWALHSKIYDFLAQTDSASWRSMCVNKKKVCNELSDFELSTEFKTLILRKNYYNEPKTNLTPIKRFVYVENLDFSGNALKSLEDLSVFTKLKELNLSSNELKEVKAFPVLPELKSLYLYKNALSGIAELTVLPELEDLDVANNGSISIKGVGGIIKLKHLDLSENTVSDMKELSAATNLTSLMMSNMQNMSFKELPVIPNLKEIDLSNNSLASKDIYLVNILKEFPSLISINVSGNELGSLFFITNYRFGRYKESLKEQEDYSTFYGRIENLDMSNNRIYSLNGSDKFINLKQINISSNNLIELSPLFNLKKIEILKASYNNVNDLDGLEALSLLKEIAITNNKIANIMMLGKIPSLRYINFSANQIEELPDLRGLNQLETLFLSNNKISDIKNLRNLKSLRYLDISYNPISDYSPLYNLKQLTELRVNGIDQSHLIKLKNNLPDTRIISDGVNTSDFNLDLN